MHTAYVVARALRSEIQHAPAEVTLSAAVLSVRLVLPRLRLHLERRHRRPLHGSVGLDSGEVALFPLESDA